jgi:hypothetical protein
MSLGGGAAVVGVGISRRELPMIPAEYPLVMWLMQGPVPTPKDAGPRDGLILGTSALMSEARGLGWTPQRLKMARPSAPQYGERGRLVAVVADRGRLETESRKFSLGSHRLLFEAIAQELVGDPMALGAGAMEYLRDRAGQLGVRLEHLDLRVFLDELIGPAYAEGIAKLLVRRGLPVRVYGRGWDRDKALAPYAAAALDNATALRLALAEVAVVIDVWPTEHAPAIELWGRPVVRARGVTADRVENAARAAMQHEVAAEPQGAVLTQEALSRFVDSLPRA